MLSQNKRSSLLLNFKKYFVTIGLVGHLMDLNIQVIGIKIFTQVENKDTKEIFSACIKTQAGF